MGKCSFWLDLTDSKAQNTCVAGLFSKWGGSIWKQKSAIGFRLIGFQFIITANQRTCLGIYFYYTEFFLNWGTHKHSAEGENKKGENSSILLYPYPLLCSKDEQDSVWLYGRRQPKIKTFALQDIKWKTNWARWYRRSVKRDKNKLEMEGKLQNDICVIVHKSKFVPNK